MYRLARILKSYYHVILFVILEVTAISFYARSTSYTRATLLATANRATGRVSAMFTAVGDYFSLARTNKILLERLADAQSQIAATGSRTEGEIAATGDSDDAAAAILQKYRFTTARVISNSIARQDNFFVIDKGTGDGVSENMAILAPNGAVAGYVYSCSENFAVCMSVLNRRFSIGGQIKGTEYFGSASWDGTNPHEITLSDIPRYAQVGQGDTVLSAYSLRFPPECPLGTVTSIGESEDGTTHVIRLRLAARIGALSNVMVVKYSDFDELNSLAGSLFLDHSATKN